MASNARAIRAGRAFVELFADDTLLVRGLRRAEKRLKTFGEGVRRLGLKMVGLGTAFAAPMLASGKVFGDFENQMKMVSTMLTEPEKYMDAFSQGIRKLSVEFGESTDVLAKGLYDLLSASVDPARALEVLAIATKAAKGGMTDTAVAVDGLTSVLNAFQMSADRAGHVANVMFQTVKRGKLTFTDLAANIGKVAPMARAAGMSMEDMMAAIATMTRQGLSTEEASTRLVNMLKTAPDQARDIAALIQKYVGKSLSEIQADFPEIRAAGGIAALAADIKGFRQDLALMQNAAGQADEAFSRMTGGLSYELKRARMALNELMISIGQALAPTLKAASDWFKKVALAASAWVKANSGVIVSALKLTAAVVAVGVGLTVFGTVLIGLAKGIAILATIVSVAMAVFKALAAVIAFLTTPVGLVVAAVAALAGVILYATGVGGRALAWLGDRFRALAERARKTFGGIADALAAGEIGLAARILWLGIKMEWARGVNALEAIWLDFRNSFIRIGYDAWTSLLASIATVWNAIETGWIDTVAFFGSVWSRFTSFFAISWERLKAIAAKSWAWIRGVFSDSAREGRDAVYSQIDRQRDAAIAGIESDRDRDLARREAEHERRREGAARIHEATLGQLGMENLAKHEELDAEYERRMAENEAELEAARREWQEAIDEARKRRQARDIEGAPDDIESRLGRAFEDMGDLLSDQVAKINARGTFMVANVLGLQAGDATDRMAGGIEKIERNTRPLRNAEALSFD
jgi:hypothetical protein